MLQYFKSILSTSTWVQYFDIMTNPTCRITYVQRKLLNISLSIVYCLQPPTIEHARHSALPEQATFDLDATVQYNCHTGYVTNGFPRAKCLAIDGQASWYGPDISCERECFLLTHNSITVLRQGFPPLKKIFICSTTSTTQ